MSKLGKDLVQSAKEALAIASGEMAPEDYQAHVPPEIDVRAIRKRLRMSQKAFAARYGFSLGSVRDWEQGRSSPVGHARAYLLVIDKEKEAVDRALSVA